jgi:hypothetical protein
MMTISGDSLERALRRYWFRHPQCDGTPWIRLTPAAQRSVAAEAVKIEREHATGN